MGSGQDFADAIAPILSQFRCLLVDLPGHGKTEVAQDADYQMVQTAEGLIGLLNELKIESCFLAGYSLGGRIACYLTLHFPLYFRAAVWESASPGLRTPAEQELRCQQDLLLAQKLQQDFVGFLEQWYANPLFSSFRQHPNYDRAIAQRLQNDPAQLAKSLLFLGLGKQPSLWQQLAANRIPILLLVGELDSKFIAINRAIAAVCPHSNLNVVASSGHNVHFEQPEIYARTISDFFFIHR